MDEPTPVRVAIVVALLVMGATGFGFWLAESILERTELAWENESERRRGRLFGSALVLFVGFLIVITMTEVSPLWLAIPGAALVICFVRAITSPTSDEPTESAPD